MDISTFAQIDTFHWVLDMNTFVGNVKPLTEKPTHSFSYSNSPGAHYLSVTLTF